MKITCIHCGIVNRPHACPYKKRKTDRNRVDNIIYESKEYRKLRREVLEDFNYIDVFQFYVNSVTIQATTTHHIVEVLEDESKAVDYDNLIPLNEHASHKLIHNLYNRNTRTKIKLQELLKKMRQDYLNNDRELGRYEAEFNKIISPPILKKF